MKPHTRGNYHRAESHYTGEAKKGEVLRLWAAHVRQSEISRRTGLTTAKIGDIIRNALQDGEIEEKRIIHGGGNSEND